MPLHPDYYDTVGDDDRLYSYHAEDSIPERAILLYDAHGNIVSTKKPKGKIGYATASR